jgi:hypothetical protein
LRSGRESSTAGPSWSALIWSLIWTVNRTRVRLPNQTGTAVRITNLEIPDKSNGGEGGIRTLGTGVSPYNGLANRRIRPLCHLSDHFKGLIPCCSLVPHEVQEFRTPPKRCWLSATVWLIQIVDARGGRLQRYGRFSRKSPIPTILTALYFGLNASVKESTFIASLIWSGAASDLTRKVTGSPGSKSK